MTFIPLLISSSLTLGGSGPSFQPVICYVSEVSALYTTSLTFDHITAPKHIVHIFELVTN